MHLDYSKLKPTHTRSIAEIPVVTCLEIRAPASSGGMAIYKVPNAINCFYPCYISDDLSPKILLANKLIPRFFLMVGTAFPSQR